MISRRFGHLVFAAATVFANAGVRHTATAGAAGKRHAFQPFSEKDETELVKVITTKPRHVLRHVRQQVWKARKRELHFRNTVTQLMIVVQDYLRKQLLEPEHASVIMEGVLEDCVRYGQHDMAHLLFRAFLRFRKFGCSISINALRNLFDSYKGTDNAEMMQQLANEMEPEEGLRAFCIAAHLFAGNIEAAEKLTSSLSLKDFEAQDLIAIAEGYDKLSKTKKVTEIVENFEKYGLSKDAQMEVFTALFKIFHRRDDEKNFAIAFDKARQMRVPFNPIGFATVLRMQMRHAQSLDDVGKIETELRTLGYEPDLTGNSVIISAYARMMHFGDKTSEEVMISKVDTLLASIENQIKKGDPEMDVSSAHVRAVVRGYGAAGRPEMMKAAFSRMQCRGISNDTRVFNEMLKWYSLMGNVKDVLMTKAEMAKQEVRPDASTYTWVFRAIGKWYPRQAEKFYTELQEQGISPDIGLYTTLLGIFGDLGQFDRVEAILQALKRREAAGTIPVTPGTFAVLLRIFSKDVERCHQIFEEAHTKGLGDHPHVITSFFHALATHPRGDEKLDAALSRLSKWPVDVYNVLLHMYAKRGNKTKVEELINKMKEEKVEFNEVTFGTLMTAFGRWKNAAKVGELVDLLKAKEGQISANFYSILAAAYSKLGDSEGIDDAWEDLLNSRLFPDTETYNTFLSLYGKTHNVSRMQVVMDNMLRQVPPNPLTATTVVDVLGKSGRLTEMETLMGDMRKSPDTAPTSVTYHQAMNAYAKSSDVVKMERARDEMLANGFEENAVSFNILAEGYGRARRFEQLNDLLERRKRKGIEMDELGYCVLISTYGRVRSLSEVAGIAEEIKNRDKGGIATTTRMKWALIDAFCRCQDVKMMQEWVDSLGPLRIPDKKHLISYYCRVKSIDQAEQLVSELEKDKEDLSFAALQALARGYATIGRFDKSVEILHKLRDRGFVPDAATAMLLSQQFLKAGLHEQAQQVILWRKMHSKSGDDGTSEEVII